MFYCVSPYYAFGGIVKDAFIHPAIDGSNPVGTALHGNFDTIAVRVQNGCKRVHRGAVCADFYSTAATGGVNSASALATVTVMDWGSSASVALKYTVYSPALTAVGISSP